MRTVISPCLADVTVPRRAATLLCVPFACLFVILPDICSLFVREKATLLITMRLIIGTCVMRFGRDVSCVALSTSELDYVLGQLRPRRPPPPGPRPLVPLRWRHATNNKFRFFCSSTQANIPSSKSSLFSVLSFLRSSHLTVPLRARTYTLSHL